MFPSHLSRRKMGGDRDFCKGLFVKDDEGLGARKFSDGNFLFLFAKIQNCKIQLSLFLKPFFQVFLPKLFEWRKEIFGDLSNILAYAQNLFQESPHHLAILQVFYFLFLFFLKKGHN